MNDAEKIKAVEILYALLEAREEFIGQYRWRSREWARLCFFAYYRVRSDSGAVFALDFARALGKRVDLSPRHKSRLRWWDNAISSLGDRAGVEVL